MSENPIIKKALLGEEPGSEPKAKEEIKKFLANLGDSILGLVPDLVREEMKKRMDEVEKKLTDMKREFGEDLFINNNPDSSRTINPSRKPKKRKITKGNENTAASTSVKQARGQLTKIIMDLLVSGPKSRADIVAELNRRNISTQSLGTLLNRMKKNDVIDHNVGTKVYSLPDAAKDHPNPISDDA